MKELAADYFSHFFFGSHAGRLHLSLSPHAPEPLKALVDKLCGASPSQDSLCRLFRCLCVMAQQEASIGCQEPPQDMLLAVGDALRRQARA